MGGFSTIGGVTEHTKLKNKEVAGVIDHADLSVTRAKLEYPTTGVSFAYLAVINKLAYCSEYAYGGTVLTVDSFADKSVRAVVNPKDYSTVIGRCSDRDDYYYSVLNASTSTGDHYLSKYVAGTVTRLATEAVDIDASGEIQAISCTGTTIKSLRHLLTSPVAQTSIPTWTATLTVTDTSHASGKFGVKPIRDSYPHGYCDVASAMLDAPLSPTPKPIAFFEVPVVGSGTLEDPFRAQMPEEIVVDVKLGKRNLLALTHSALIPTDSTGKPIHSTCIVRVFMQTDRDPALHPIPKCLDAVRAMTGVRELSREGAVARAKVMDDRLTDVDLISIPATHPNFKQILRDYIAHRETLGVKRELIDEKFIERYLTEEKGW